MHDKTDAIIYVGKAISLKNRVRQYFQAGRNVTPKIERMISQIDHFEYIITDSEVEALVLESNLIKEHRPKYNTMLKDDKNYPYIRATIEEDFPRLLIARELKRDKSKYFGPFTSAGADRVKQLGIITIVLSAISVSITDFIYERIHLSSWNMFDDGGSVTLGICLLLLAMVIRYGAELEQKAKGGKV